jgi:hypothetical protein
MARLPELERQPRLAHAGLANHRDGLAGASGGQA